MRESHENLIRLNEKLDSLLKRQDEFSKEIDALRLEISKLTENEAEPDFVFKEINQDRPIIESDFNLVVKEVVPEFGTKEEKGPEGQYTKTDETFAQKKAVRTDIERFIGENLINKVGIAITVIGVAIGAKYSIDNDLISPLTRIILGYLFGLGLLGLGMKLKEKYENYSAVLVGGAMAILYFITFAAYGHYDLIPQGVAFVLMSVFTVFTVIAAIHYNRQLMAHIGLVGAYAVPFILSDGSGKVAVLFSYMAILNIGILAIAFRKYWKALYFVAFGLTWLIFVSWFVSQFQTNEHLGLALVFVFIFFVTFYLTFLAYKLIQNEKFVLEDIIVVLINSFLFYGLGYFILDGHDSGKELLGVFTVANAVLHFVASVIVYRQKVVDRDIQYLIAGMVLVFITISVPVQLDGNWVTCLWAAEAVLLFWIGRTKSITFYERLSYPLMLFAFLSILQDWIFVYHTYTPSDPSSRITCMLNVNFLTSLLFIACFGFINWLNQKKEFPSGLQAQTTYARVISFVLPAILIFVVYNALRLEIATHWNQMFDDSEIRVYSENGQDSSVFWNRDLLLFKNIWIINYSLIFVSVLILANRAKLKNKTLGMASLVLVVFVLLSFLTAGLSSFGELRENFLDQTLSQYYSRGKINLWLRYPSFSLVALTLFSCFIYLRDTQWPQWKGGFELLLHATVLWIVSNEFVHWADICTSEQSYKLGLTVLWGVYSLFLIAWGIRKKNKPMRIGAIVLFGLTLIKLFFYDIAHLATIPKTVVFVSLGVLLLIISFLYNKYNHLISNDESDN